MNPFVLDQCKQIMQKLDQKPIANLLKTNWTDLSGALTLEKINEKLASNIYASPFDLFLDIRLLLEERDPQNPSNATTNIILKDISQWIINKFHNMPRIPEELEYFQTKKLVEKINMVFNAMIIKSDNSDATYDLTAQTQLFASPKMPQAGQKRLELLQQRIEHLRTPNELQAVLSILQRHIPQFSLAPEVVIEGRYITKACANELREYLNSVNA
ncbi:hypothetical protein TRFO_14102 [Tritrichomonas foetus]|uniref:Uncharacterized protein n=1 Tax=Tritrichomonas foetus TaxID=1144522 RepID=A0A1J4L068_9EUKA|nr:hypothetical protein TRFO_14102 [Tritrichomonas foetus]|eukprot:OHT15358.1 hypothetical protein TRFO_14102 [Tritrichomonas foetus]